MDRRLLQLFERRKGRRQGFSAHALIKHDSMEFPGEIRDVSNKGIYLVTYAPYIRGDQVELTIYFQQDRKKLSITLPSRVARVDGFGVGLVSPNIDVHRMMQLELIFAVHNEDTPRLIEEFCRSI